MRALMRPLSHAARTAAAHARGLAAFVSGQEPRSRIRIAYALRVPPPSEVAHGGIIKLQHLQHAFEESPLRFNVLYLVSSRLPAAANVLAAWARRKGARVVLNQNGVAYPAWHGPGWQQTNRTNSTLLAAADHVFYQSAFCKVSADRFAAPARGANEVLHNPVDTTRFTPVPTRPVRPLTLLLAGSQDQRYRFESAVAALARVRANGIDARLLVTGRLRWNADGASARDDAGKILRSSGVGDHVELLGQYTQEAAPAIFNRADLLIHTKYNDPCPTVVLEALACGLPVVYSRSGGVPELVGDDAGHGVDAPLDWERDIPPAPDALAAGVMTMLEDLPRRAAAARERAVGRFDVRHWLARHAVVLQDLIATS
jgi:glycosyltransferase involved in cell wall biosynthesis